MDTSVSDAKAIAFTLCCPVFAFAGATGAVVALKCTNTDVSGSSRNALSYTLALTAGFVLYTSLAVLTQEGKGALEHEHKKMQLVLASSLGLMLGAAFVVLIDYCTHTLGMSDDCCSGALHANSDTEEGTAKKHHGHGVHEHDHGEHEHEDEHDHELGQFGWKLAIAFGLHHIPDGMMIYKTASKGQAGLPIAIALGLHYILESFPVSVSLYRSSKSAVWAIAVTTLVVGFSSTVGGLIAMVVKGKNDVVNFAMNQFTAGMMLYIAVGSFAMPLFKCNVNTKTMAKIVVAGAAIMAFVNSQFGHGHDHGAGSGSSHAH